MPYGFRLGRCVFLLAVSLLAGAGARARTAELDLTGLVVCGVPPTEAVAYTERNEERIPDRNRPNSRWTATGPDSHDESRYYEAERKALAAVTTSVHPGVEPTHVCDITTGSGETYRFWRLNRDLDQPYIPRARRNTVPGVLYRGLRRTGRILAFTAKAYLYVGGSILLSPGTLLKQPDAVLFIPLAPLVVLAMRCQCRHDHQFGEYDARQGMRAQEFTFSYTR